ncbi:hypothetical protein ACLHZ7_12885, partial [Aeromonas salmonicida]|uniref:hypothetical protein n=1 Tax=Aeromonas salmonicida TaxID=645 RepID=UPI003D04078D
MTTLLLDHPDYQLTLQDGLLHLAHPDLPSRLYSLGQISRLMVGHGITLSSDLLLKLAERDIDFIVSAPRSAPVFRTIRSSHLTSSFLHRG